MKSPMNYIDEHKNDTYEANPEATSLSAIEIRKVGITKLNTDAIVNAANEGLWEGGGVCGAIFREAGSTELTKACQDFIKDNPDYKIKIIFAVLDDEIKKIGNEEFYLSKLKIL